MHDADKGYRLRDFAFECLNKVWPGCEKSLRELGWRFEWCRSKRTLGWCKPDRKTIELSPYYLHESEEKLRDTVLHEIAHALAGCQHGHGPEWKRWCLIVGAKPARCASGVATSAEHRWIGKCQNCGIEIKYHRKPKYMQHGMFHKACGPTVGKLTWIKNA